MVIHYTSTNSERPTTGGLTTTRTKTQTMMRGLSQIASIAALLALLCRQTSGNKLAHRSRILVNGDANFEYVASTDVSFL